jgi:hypothetical protein
MAQPLWRRVAELDATSKERIVAAAGVSGVVDENRRAREPPGWGFARIPSLEHFYQVSASLLFAFDQQQAHKYLPDGKVPKL